MVRPHDQKSVAWRVVVPAVLALSVGAAVYALLRLPGHAALWPTALQPGSAWGEPFGAGAWAHALVGLTGSLPTALHTFAFALLTAQCLPLGRTASWGACAAWTVINLAFECGQHLALAPTLAQALDAWTGGPTLLSRFFVLGRFDPLDLLAACVGGVLAAVWLARCADRPAEPPMRRMDG